MDNLKNPVIAFGRSPDGIRWDTPDGAPIKDVFLLATPFGTEDVHVQVLASIASALALPGSRALIEEAADRAGLFQVLRRLLAQKKPADEPTGRMPMTANSRSTVGGK